MNYCKQNSVNNICKIVHVRNIVGVLFFVVDFLCVRFFLCVVVVVVVVCLFVQIRYIACKIYY